ncbi:prolyl oligopeptidase family serine peptidase [Aequorivita antarctica]|uniref:S9 family peptidase n=1 Tax=Aequorivita antarctica TaxID=153266 RepID=A0A5C6YXH9_9FLAO|nr:prolyl oligopeptidase family serine peptidase [Aequorivita antarctica]TXD72339.1 S9 family peptidase [Aequorivita antarctica]SRX74480.1 Prolyl endopeptidase [Aequorivita antarctica]
MKNYILLLLTVLGISQGIKAQEDKYLWLEEVDGKEALQFVEKQNKATVAELSAEKNYQDIYDKNLAILNSTEKIAYPTIHGNYAYNFWKDQDHVRGIWRRSKLESYKSGNPVWETLLDIDKLSAQDNKKWVYKGSYGLYPDYNRFLIQLSNGGGDAVYIKEFDVNKKQFIENGFSIDEAKSSAAYLDENNLIVSNDFGEGTMTTSGYARQVKLWKRGTLLKDAQLIYEAETTDVLATGFIIHDGDKQYTLLVKASSFLSAQLSVWLNNKRIPLDIPEDAAIGAVAYERLIIKDNQFVIQLKSDWTVNNKTYTTGTLISLNFTELLKGNKDIKVILKPDEFSSISGISTTKTKLLVNVLTDVTSNLFVYSFTNGNWVSKKVAAPKLGALSVVATSNHSDQYFFDFENFITPTTLYLGDASSNNFTPYQSLPTYFDTSNLEVKQYKAKSKDGTMIPYFMVSRKDLKMDGTNPTLVYAYGGFEISSSPFYWASMGVSWLDKGGVFVLANIRGGGEYGPKWHLDAIKENRQNAFDDLYAVSEDVIAKKITSPKHLGAMGGSNGGLLVGVAFTQRPDLYNAIVCQVPLLDMQRYNKLLAGASWMSEFGDPDIPEEWAYIKKYSPYHNLKEGTDYPEVYFGTSTRDDRVHPGHARKMVAKMNDMGYKTYYYENTEGGHAGSSTNEQSAKSNALTYSYLLKKLK